MTLPRYWPAQVRDQLDQVRLTGKDAVVYAEQNKEIELEYYEIVCASTYGPVLEINKNWFPAILINFFF